ncbi:MAG: cysteine desulfurase family protein [Acidimicrobiales bacterium]
MSRHYLDYASTAPLRPEARDAMIEMLQQGLVADPGRVHTEGRMSRAILEQAREQVAGLLGCRPREVVLTSGATESINAAITGAAARWADATGQPATAAPVVAADVEHSAVSAASERHRRLRAAVDEHARIETESVRAVLQEVDDVALINVQMANHEVGTIQPVAEIAELAAQHGALVHVDAAQAVGSIDFAFADLGADLVSVSGHKFGGPPGTGALVIRRGLRVPPLMVGGEQERARRGGMENVVAMVGMGAAAEAAAAQLTDFQRITSGLTERLLASALEVPGVVAYGDPIRRLPHLVCVGVDGVEAEAVLLGLDQAGIAAHSGSACSSESLEPSPVLLAMGVEAERSLRISVGWNSTSADAEAFAAAFPMVISRLRGLRS